MLPIKLGYQETFPKTKVEKIATAAFHENALYNWKNLNPKKESNEISKELFLHITNFMS